MTGPVAPPFSFHSSLEEVEQGNNIRKKTLGAVSTQREGKAQAALIPPYKGTMRPKGQENKQITEQGIKMKFVQYNTLRLKLRSTGESAEQPPQDLNGTTPNQPRPSL